MYHLVSDILKQSKEKQCDFWEVVLQADADERGVSGKESFETMRQMYQAMKEADLGYNPKTRSASKMAGGDGQKLHDYNVSGKNICGDFVGQVMEKAIKMGESNACMHRIVAAPTAGSCGVIPAVFLVAEQEFSLSEDKMVEAMFVSAGVGSVIAENASLAGASGGCQAEIGSASAMAAAGLVYLQGGDGNQIADAAAFALKNMLGLACDPVGGLVEVPCIKRNISGAVNALTSAQLAMAGIKSAIPVDEVIDAMRRIGNEMPASIKETSLGGLATSPTAQQMKL
ncbi:MAG: L-serine ammonia-lyase, iron-sulfur-dependent, subunit alpha [Lachnospiraceae bacterium]|nr:L-serine ammonia-lyase, iron-sulfur-dependent, subunit alpha [Lachnospiraceae bacterium]